MASKIARIKPASGFSHFFHIFLMALLPALVFILVRLRFYDLAAALILLSKWRMLAVRPRHWPANIRANAVDIIVGLSLLIFMAHSGSMLMQLIWAIAYAIWLISIKPMSSLLGVSFQALIAQTVGLCAIFINWGDAPLYVLVVLTWVICYVSARQFFAGFEEPLTRFMSNVWGYFGAALVWVLGHWLLFYGVIAQPTLLLTVIGFSLGGVYYLEKTDRLSVALRRQLIFIMIAIIVIVLAFSHWDSRTL